MGRTIRAGAVLPPVFDAFENFPEGGRAVWPPLHDATLALVARLGGSTSAAPERGMPLAALVPVVQLVLAILVAAALAAGTGGAAGVAAATVLFAAMPTILARGAFGELDHNMTEVLGALLLFLVARRAVAEGTGGRRRLLAGSAAWACALLVALGFHTGLLLSAGVVAAAALAAALFEGAGSGAPLAAGFALAAASLPLFAGMRVTPDPGDPWRLGPVYALVLALGAIGCATAELIFLLRRGRGTPATRNAPAAPDAGAPLTLPRETPVDVLRRLGNEGRAAICAGAAALVVLALIPGAAWGGFLRGLGFLGARDPWLASIAEFQPAWTDPDAVKGALPGLLVAPAALAAAAFSRPPRAKAARLLAIALPFAAFTLLGVVQQRFLPVAGAFAAAAGGAALGLLGSGRARALAAAAFLAGLVTAGPIVALRLREAWRGEADRSLTAPEVVAAVLRESTPDPGDPPAWGVLAPWDYGHAILFGAGRAVALDNFGSWHPGFEEKMGILVETSPRRAVDALARLRLRYVVAPFPPPVLYALAHALGRSPSEWVFDASVRSTGLYAGTAAGERTLLFRLHKRDAAPLPGDGPEDAAASRRFRKVWESPEGTAETGPLLKIFEVVAEGRP